MQDLEKRRRGRGDPDWADRRRDSYSRSSPVHHAERCRMDDQALRHVEGPLRFAVHFWWRRWQH